MAEIVFILGAGASKEAGAPVMSEFLEIARELQESGSLESNIVNSYDTLLNVGIPSLTPLLAKANLDTLNLESIFATFEMAKMLEQLSGYSQDKINEIYQAIK